MNTSPEPKPTHTFDWADVAFASKKPLNELKAIFVVAPREISTARFKQLVKQYLPQGNIVLGLAKEPYVTGFEDQPQFRMLQGNTVEALIAKVNTTASSPHQIYTLSYFQRELSYILDKISFVKVILINGSWKHVFHTSPAYYILATEHIPYEMISPFTDEAEAKAYEARIDNEIYAALDHDLLAERGREDLESAPYTEVELLEMANRIAARSYDYSFQTGAVLARRSPKAPDLYDFLIYALNKVVPYQTYAMHHGASREKHFSPPNDLNHYDAVHAEVWLLIEAQKAAEQNNAQDLRGTTLFINLMPCPPCARMLSQTSIEEIVYSIDHSDGYAVKMLEAAGKKVRRLVP